jgi:membrane-bound lytic murein transglycosylase D
MRKEVVFRKQSFFCVKFKSLLKWICVALTCTIINSASYASLNLEGIQVYPKTTNRAGQNTRLADDVIRYQNANANLWDLLRSEFTLPHYENSAVIQEHIQWWLDNQDFLLRTTTRSAPFLYFIHQQVKKRKLPVELVLIPIIESGYNPFDYSSAGAAGLWQLMPNTASGLGVKQDWWYDGRRDVIASTRAALNYLAYLFDFFDGNSLLAIAAYNTGEGSVLSAIKRNIREGKSTDFWSLPLPKETRIYVPRLLALATIIAHPEAYRIQFPAVRNAPYLAQVDIGSQIDLKRAAAYAGMSLKQFQHLNPGYNYLVTHPKGPYKLVLPIERVERFMTQLAHNSQQTPHINWIQYKVKSTDTLESIAKNFHTTSFAVREINHLKKVQLKKGMRLVIPKTVTSSPVTLADSNNLSQSEILPTAASHPVSETGAPELTVTSNHSAGSFNMQAGDTLYMVRNNDTVEKIAEHFNLPAALVYKANHLHPSSLIHSGDQLLIPTHLARTEKAIHTQPDNDIRKLAPGDTLYMVRRGDTMEKIAEKFKTTPAAIRVANLMSSSSLQEGEHIIVPTHLTGNLQG